MMSKIGELLDWYFYAYKLELGIIIVTMFLWNWIVCGWKLRLRTMIILTLAAWMVCCFILQDGWGVG